MNEALKQKLAHYKSPEKIIELIKNTEIVFLVGVTGAGKDTVIHELLKSGDYHNMVSHTTREPRFNHGILEQDGVEYHFVDLKTIETMLDAGGFVEAKQFGDNIYGTSVAEIQMAHDEGKIAVTEIEVQGVAEYKKVSDHVVPIFLLPPDFDTWQQRIHKRYGDTVDQAEVKKRLITAKVEFQEALDKDYFEYVINQDLNTVVRVVDEIAHGKFSREKNDHARTIARQLLEDLENHLEQL
jgi:guanylate kinase